MRFCSACGRRLGQPTPVTCPGCGVRHWRNAKPCAGALITRAGRLLLVRRGREPFAGLLDIPGGYCEPGEHPIRTAIREALEETGLPIEVTGFLGIWLDPPLDAYSAESLIAFYHARPTDDRPPTVDEHEVVEAVWYGPDELPERLAFPGHAGRVLRAWAAAVRAGRLAGPLPDAADVGALDTVEGHETTAP